MNNKTIAHFCIFLIVMLPICLADEFEQEGESLIIEAKKYEPETLRSDYMEQLNIPVRVILGAIRGAPISVPEIESVHVELVKQKEAQKENASVSGTSEEVIENYVSGTPKFYKAPYPSLDNLGYLQITLKKIPEEHKVPKKIDLDFKATIGYEAEIPTFTIGGENTVVIQPGTEKMVEEEREKHSILGGMYYIRVSSIKGKKASMEILDQEFEKINGVTLEEGEISRSINLHRDIEPESVRLKLEEVRDTGIVTLKFEGEDKARDFDKKEEIGGGWEIPYYYLGDDRVSGDEYIILQNEDYKSVKVILTTEETGNYDGVEDIQALLDENLGCVGNNCKLYQRSSITPLRNYVVNKEEFQNALRSLENLGLEKLEKVDPKKTQRFAIFAGKGDKRYYVGDEIGGTCKCEITSITEDYVRVSGVRECDEYARSNTETLEVDKALGICDDILEVDQITTDQVAVITALPGKGKGETTTYFSIHIPVEERVIQYTPEELQRKINRTQKTIEKLDKTITNLEKLVEGWTKVCLATAAIFTVMSFFEGVSGKAKETGVGEPETAEAEKVQKITLKFPAGVNELTIKRDLREDKKQKLSSSEEYILQEGIIYKGNNAIATSDFKFLDSKTGDYYKVNNDGYFTKVDEYSGNFRSGDGSGREDVIVSSDLNKIVVPLKRCSQLTKSEFVTACETHRENLGTALYLVYDKEVDYIQGWWGGIDGKLYRYDKSGKEDGDKPLDGLFIDGRTPEGKNLRTELDRLRDAYQRKETSFKFKGQTYNLGKTHLSPKKDGVECVKVMSEAQCKILFNACDPVMCPASRCDFGGRYRAPNDNVIQSGFFGSLMLCLPNIKDGVIMPVCLSGILASLKNLRSILQGYVDCLQAALQDDKAVGICERIRSIYICEILWREAMTMIGLARGNLLDAAISRGGGEYLTGVRGGVENAKRTVDYFTKDYATSVFAAYRGRSSEEIGTEICERAIYGKGPILGEIMEDVTKAQNPPQFTAYLEEQPLYSETSPQSAYKLYYHIYSGSETVNYKVYIKKDTRTYTCSECSGTIEPDNFIDKSTLFMYEPYFEEVCVYINGRHYCNFGKVVSSSFGVNQANNYILEYELSKRITTEAQCRADPRGYVPEAQVEKTCSQLNPGIGKGADIEEQWKKVGTCGKNEQGVSLGDCWIKLGDLEETNPELYRDTVSDICKENGGETCNVNQKCDGREERTSVSSYQGVVCCYGTCTGDDKYAEIGSELLEEDFIKTDSVYQVTYEQGKETCADRTIGTTNPFKDAPADWFKKEEPRKETKEYNQYHYFKGIMYLLCDNCADAQIEFNELKGDYFEKACGENEIGNGGKMFERCKETCDGKKAKTTEEAEKEEEEVEKKTEGLEFKQLMILYDTKGVQTKITEFTQAETWNTIAVDLETGGAYQIELHFSEPLVECSISSDGTKSNPSALTTSCKTEEFFNLVGNEITVSFEAKSKEGEGVIGSIILTNKEESVEDSKPIICKTDGDEPFCIGNTGERCSDYYSMGHTNIRAKFYKTFDTPTTFGGCQTECGNTFKISSSDCTASAVRYEK